MEGLPGDPAARVRRGQHRQPAGWSGRAGAALSAQPTEPQTEAAPEAEPSSSAGDDSVTIVTWRHGQTTYNAEHRFQGQTDIPLNQNGYQQAARAARYLAALRPTAIYSSDLGRAADTAGALARLTGLPVTHDKELRERHGGEWEGLTDTEIRERYPDAWEAWLPTGGETATQVADRAGAALHRVADSLAPGAVAVVVGHGACLGFGIARFLGIPDGLRVLGPFGNCRWSVLRRYRGNWRLLEHNVGVLPEPVPDPDQVHED